MLGTTTATFANGIKINKIIACEIQNDLLPTEFEDNESSASFTIPRGIFEQITYCAQVQLDVKETYTSVFGPDRANSIALGAFMGCMGYL